MCACCDHPKNRILYTFSVILIFPYLFSHPLLNYLSNPAYIPKTKKGKNKKKKYSSRKREDQLLLPINIKHLPPFAFKATTAALFQQTGQTTLEVLGSKTTNTKRSTKKKSENNGVSDTRSSSWLVVCSSGSSRLYRVNTWCEIYKLITNQNVTKNVEMWRSDLRF